MLDQEAVGGAIVGVRLGLTDHSKDNAKLFSFSLDAEDMGRIQEVTKKSRDLRTAFGDCGGEYRRHA